MKFFEKTGTQSKHEKVVEKAMVMLGNALIHAKHGDRLSGSQWIRVFEELVFPLITSICQTSAAAVSQMALGGVSPSKKISTMTGVSGTSTNGSVASPETWPLIQNARALKMLCDVLIKRTESMREEDGYLTVWGKVVRMTNEFGNEKGSEIKFLVNSMKDQKYFTSNVEAVTSATLRPEVYVKVMEMPKVEQGGGSGGEVTNIGREAKENDAAAAL